MNKENEKPQVMYKHFKIFTKERNNINVFRFFFSVKEDFLENKRKRNPALFKTTNIFICIYSRYTVFGNRAS